MLDGRISATFTIDPVDGLRRSGEVDPADYPSVTPELMADLTSRRASGHGARWRVCVGARVCAGRNNHQAYFDAMTGPAVHYVLPFLATTTWWTSAQRVAATLPAWPACGDDPAATRTVSGALTVVYLSDVFGKDSDFGGWLDGTAEALDGERQHR